MDRQVITQLYNQGVKMHRLLENQKAPFTDGTFNGEDLKTLLTHKGNIGVLTGEISDIIVLDLDTHTEDEPSGYESLQKLLSHLQESLPETYTVKTPTGGKHIYLKLPHSWYKTRFNPNLSDYPQIDFRNNGHYVVMDSCHIDMMKDGTHILGDYEVESGSPNYIAYAPEWLLEVYQKDIDPRFNKPRQLNALGAFCNLWNEGMTNKPNNFLIAVIRKMVESGASLTIVKRLAWYVNMTSIKASKEEFEEIYNTIFDPIKRDGILIDRKNKLGDFLEMWASGAGEGGRNIYLTQMIGRLLASGMDINKTRDIARVINRTACNPQLYNDEFNLIYNSMLKTEKRRMEDLKRRMNNEG